MLGGEERGRGGGGAGKDYCRGDISLILPTKGQTKTIATEYTFNNSLLFQRVTKPGSDGWPETSPSVTRG